jgi:PAS domain-containing protein
MRSEGNTEVLHMALTDISASVQAEELKKAVAKDQTLISAIPDLIFTNHSDGRFVDDMASDPRLLFAPPESFMGRTVREVLPPGKAKLLMDAFARALATRGVHEFEYSQPIGGKSRCFEARIVPSPPDRLITFLQDMTERKQTEETLRHLAHNDVLTQLPNRCFLHDRLEQALAICC